MASQHHLGSLAPENWFIPISRYTHSLTPPPLVNQSVFPINFPRSSGFLSELHVWLAVALPGDGDWHPRVSVHGHGSSNSSQPPQESTVSLPNNTGKHTLNILKILMLYLQDDYINCTHTCVYTCTNSHNKNENLYIEDDDPCCNI